MNIQTKPQPIFVDWALVPKGFNFVVATQDDEVFALQYEPALKKVPSHQKETWVYRGRLFRVDNLPNFIRGSVAWQDSLITRPSQKTQPKNHRKSNGLKPIGHEKTNPFHHPDR